MARKDIFRFAKEEAPPHAQSSAEPPVTVFAESEQSDLVSEGRQAHPSLSDRPLLGSLGSQSFALGAISQSLDAASEKVRRAEEIERQLSKGRVVIELDPSLVDTSFISDRMAVDPLSRSAFIAAIRDQGQQVPILVRLKPGQEGRYQVAYGHRRLDAARELGRAVLAVVQDLSDDELVMAQGQENAVRDDLSFIERARFAARLEEKRFSRETIIAALGVDRTVLSRMLTLIGHVPTAIVEAIGPAPSAGRPRWMELANLLNSTEPSHQTSPRERAMAFIATPAFLALNTNERFEALRRELSRRSVRTSPEPMIAADGARIARIVRGNRRLSLAFDDRATPDFGEFVASRLAALYDEYRDARNRNPTNH